MLLGIGHYILVSLSIILDEKAHLQTEKYSMFAYGQILSGLVIFAIANYHQSKCNTILARLKKACGGYGIPKGDWFDMVQCPLYLTEILIYISLSLITNCSNQNMLLISIWVVVNQSISAKRTRDWYKSKFSNQITKQKATLLPWVW